MKNIIRAEIFDQIEYLLLIEQIQLSKGCRADILIGSKIQLRLLDVHSEHLIGKLIVIQIIQKMMT